jgi:hypothetical protein
MREHGSPVPVVGSVQSIVAPEPACCAGPPICSKQTSPLGHAHAAVVVPEPEPDPEPLFFETHAPGGHEHDGSFSGHAQPVPSHVHAVSPPQLAASMWT